MASLNLLTLIGSAGGDAVVNTRQNGGQVSSVSIAVSEKQGDKWVPEWFRCVGWNEWQVKRMAEIKKGDVVSVVGKVNLRNFTNKENKQIYQNEVTVEKISIIVKKNPTQSADTQDIGGFS